MILTDKIKEQIKKLALNDANNEICGLIYLDKINKELKLYHCQNIIGENKKTKMFAINPLSYLRAAEKGEIVAFYHSHPAEHREFSEFDKINSENHNLTMIMYSLEKDDFYVYVPKSYSSRYVGRPFQIKTNDCFTLLKDYYLNELNIILPDFEYNDQWGDTDCDLIDKSFENSGFIKLKENEELKLHDVICFKKIEFKYPSHLGVYLGNGYFLHHAYTRLSNIDKYDDIRKKVTCYVCRHKSLIK